MHVLCLAGKETLVQYVGVKNILEDAKPKLEGWGGGVSYPKNIPYIL